MNADFFEISHDDSQLNELIPHESTRKSYKIFRKRSYSKPAILPDLKFQSNQPRITPLPLKDNKKSSFFNRGLSVDKGNMSGQVSEEPSILLAKNVSEDTRHTMDITSNLLRRQDSSMLRNIKKIKIKPLDSLNSISQHHQNSDDSMNSECQDRIMVPEVTERFYKSGYLLKKPALLKKWQMRYFEVEALKIYYARSKEAFDAKANVKCINLLTNPCELASHKGKEFSFFVGGSHTVVLLRGNSVEEANEWVTFFAELFKFAKQNYHTEQKYIPSMETLNKPDILFEEEFLSDAETGDILLFKTGSFKAKMQRVITVSDYDHIALVLRANDDVHIFEANSEEGVHLITWEQFKNGGMFKKSSRIAYRKLMISDFLHKEELKEKLWEFASMHIGKKYELNLRKMLRKASMIKFAEFQTPNPPKKKGIFLPAITPKPQIMNPTLFSNRSEGRLPVVLAYRDTQEGFFCSELIASAFKFVGLLDKNASSARYLPVSFSQKKELHLLNGAKFSSEYGLAQIEGLEIYTSR